jgi:hypothetical protein
VSGIAAVHHPPRCTESSPLCPGVPAAFAVASLAGAAWGLALKARRADTYTAIGRGPRAATTVVLPPTDYALER